MLVVVDGSDEKKNAAAGADSERGSGPRSPAQVAFLIAAMVLIPVGLIVLFLAFRGGERPNKTTSEQTVQIGPSLTGRWNTQPGPDTWVGYSVGATFANTSTPPLVEGRTSDVDGGIVISADGTLVAGAFNVRVPSLTSGNAERDKAMKTQGLETDKYGIATFVVTPGVVKVGAVPEPGKTSTIKVPGDLTLHGVTKPVEFTLEASFVPGDIPQLQTVGKTTIKLSDFGIEPPNVADLVTVGSEGDVIVHLRFAKVPDEVTQVTPKKNDTTVPATAKPGSTAAGPATAPSTATGTSSK